MRIKIYDCEDSNKVLVIRADNSADEDLLIQKWYNQIIEHLEKLNLK